MNTRLIISLLCAGALAFACGPRSHSDAPTSVASAVTLRAHDVKAAIAERPNRHTVARTQAKIDTKLNVSVAASDVRFALDVRNVGSKHAEINFPSGQSYDFAVVDSTGREVWRWSNRRIFTQGMKNTQLGAGETMELSETWKKGARAGRYTAIATLKSANFPAEQRAEFVIGEARLASR